MLYAAETLVGCSVGLFVHLFCWRWQWSLGVLGSGCWRTSTFPTIGHL